MKEMFRQVWWVKMRKQPGFSQKKSLEQYGPRSTPERINDAKTICWVLGD